MNFVHSLEAQDVAMELKYCERCGGLWLRTKGEDAVYCPGCTAHMAALPRPKRRHDLRRDEKEKLQCQVQIDGLLGVAEMEVEA